MRALLIAALSLTAAAASAQQLERVYNRDTGENFKLKSVSNNSRVMGPIVRQSTVFTFDNPHTKLTEASVWFSLDWAAVLGGFAYWFKDEYVPGVLMDKNKAWFIYTAITSRNEDPGIMVQTSPSSYHAQIFPLAVGYDLRVELTSVGFLRPTDTDLEVPLPELIESVPYEASVSSYMPQTIRSEVNEAGRPLYRVDYPDKGPLDMQIYAQRFKDGYVYVAGLVRRDDPDRAIRLSGLSKVFWTKPENGGENARWFIGRRKGSGTVAVRHRTGGEKVAQKVQANERGKDTAQLWAHQALVQKDWRSRKAVLDFSLKYGIPSTQTALLAVPGEQMKLFREKEAEFRRKQAEEARRQRSWQNRRNQNWRSTRGGDPEIRIQLPDAVRAYAILPDGRRLELVAAGDGYWGGSYDVPVSAREGEHRIRIVGIRRDGSTFETSVSYEMDRTPPEGIASVEEGWLVVRSEPKLARVIAIMEDSDEIELKESDEPGVYRLKLDGKLVSRVILYDAAHNKRELSIIR